jgi:competence protein ComEC
MICGYVLGYHLPNLPILPPLFLAFVCLAAAAWIQFGRNASKRERFWPYLFILAVTITSLVYFQQNRYFPDLWESLPPREASLQLKVKRLYASTNSSQIKGVARVIGTEDHLGPLKDYLIYFSITAENPSVVRGQRLRVRGILNYLPSKQNLSLFEQFLTSQSISLTLTQAALTAVPENGNPLEVAIGIIRQKAIDTLGLELHDFPEERSIYRGMMLGIKSELSNENKQLFLRTGTLHLFAISGLHVGIIAVTLAGIFLVLRIPRRVSVILGLSLVYLYVEITGASPSAVRAFAMTAFFWTGKSLVRQMPPFQALVASAVCVLLFAPNQLFSAGFQLSYTVVTGILAWGLPLFQTLKDQWYKRIPQKHRHLSSVRKCVNKAWEFIVGTFCISLSATLASAPLSILYFGLLAPPAVILNMALVPIASLIIISGVFSLICGFLFFPMISEFFNQGPLLLIVLTNQLLEAVVQQSGSFIFIAWKHEGLGFATVIVFLASLLLGHGYKWPKKWRFSFPVVLTVGMILLNSLIIPN